DAEVSDDENTEEEHFHTDGFDMQFDDPKDVSSDEEVELATKITMNEEALEALKVRYEIWPSDDEENIEWVDANEENAGEYIGDFTFPETGTYNIQIHVKDDDDLHEHIIKEVEVK